MRGLLVCGDALEGLGLVEPGSARLAYLDPPFNTHERWADYDDSLDHDEWLATTGERIEASWSTLHETGSLWVHCDDRMQAYLRVLMDDRFGRDAFVATVIWQRRYSRENRKAIGAVHDYLHVYAPLGAGWREHRNRLERRDRPGTWRNPDEDPRGPWSTTSLVAQGGHGTRAQFYAITTPAGKTVQPPPGSCWRVTRERFEELHADGLISFGRSGANVPRKKVHERDAKGLVPWTWWPRDEVGDNQEARRETRFSTPKPERLLQRVIEIATNREDLVIDPFLGSGTTAVVAHRLGRRWVGVELRRAVLDEHVLPRLERVGAAGSFEVVSAARRGEGPLVD